MDRVIHLTQVDSFPNTYAQNSLTLIEDEIIDIEEAEYVDRYKLRLRFSNHIERVVDFEPFLATSTNPMIRKYLDLTNFKKFVLEYGDLHWNDYDLCFPIADLYTGHL